jgi:hypothetical protein
MPELFFNAGKNIDLIFVGWLERGEIEHYQEG